LHEAEETGWLHRNVHAIARGGKGYLGPLTRRKRWRRFQFHTGQCVEPTDAHVATLPGDGSKIEAIELIRTDIKKRTAVGISIDRAAVAIEITGDEPTQIRAGVDTGRVGAEMVVAVGGVQEGWRRGDVPWASRQRGSARIFEGRLGVVNTRRTSVVIHDGISNGATADAGWLVLSSIADDSAILQPRESRATSIERFEGDAVADDQTIDQVTARRAGPSAGGRIAHDGAGAQR